MAPVMCSGNFATWDEALAASTGYYLPEFIEQTRIAALKVKDGLAAYERDSVLFDEVQHAFPLLTALLRAAVEREGQLTVFDFGGGFGTSYFQCRHLLGPLRSLQWLIVDQPAHVAIGQREFESDELRFYRTPAELLDRHQPDLLLLSSVLPYVPLPYERLSELLRVRIRYVVVDRTFFLVRGADRLTVQHGPFDVYPGSYPAWFLSEPRLLNMADVHGYDVLAAFDGFDQVEPDDEPAYSKGFIFASRSRIR